MLQRLQPLSHVQQAHILLADKQPALLAQMDFTVLQLQIPQCYVLLDIIRLELHKLRAHNVQQEAIVLGQCPLKKQLVLQEPILMLE